MFEGHNTDVAFGATQFQGNTRFSLNNETYKAKLCLEVGCVRDMIHDCTQVGYDSWLVKID